MINTIKKKLQLIFKQAGYKLYFLFYGKISGVLNAEEHEDISVKKISSADKIEYNIYTINKSRLYTDTVTDTAFIYKNKIIKGPSFQYRKTFKGECEENIVLEKGTPRFLKKLNGNLFSLLTGGAGNANYFHWMFDVLPRLSLLEKNYALKEIDYFLLPNISKKFQIESLDILNIPNNQRLSSDKFRHVEAKKIITVDHPYALGNDLSNAIQNVPVWIIKWLRKKFLNISTISKKELPLKFYIDRKDSTSNTKDLRKIINEDKVIEILRKNGYTPICLADLSLLDQVKIFKNATDIVGLHGAGFANLPFCNPGAKLLEIKTFDAGSMYANIARLSNVVYDEISIKPLKFNDNNQFGHIEVPLEILKDKVK